MGAPLLQPGRDGPGLGGCRPGRAARQPHAARGAGCGGAEGAERPAAADHARLGHGCGMAGAGEAGRRGNNARPGAGPRHGGGTGRPWELRGVTGRGGGGWMGRRRSVGAGGGGGGAGVMASWPERGLDCARGRGPANNPPRLDSLTWSLCLS